MPKGKVGMAVCAVEKAIPQVQTKTPATAKPTGVVRTDLGGGLGTVRINNIGGSSE